ncbi:MAG TPA: hypothetical protein VGT00_14310 [Methylomirabilota bacterium]|nr:hypothetical protein [Methylomirabilota bacterium]
MGNLSKIAGTVLGTTTVAALPLSAGAGTINESFPPDGNDSFPGQLLGPFFAAGDIFNGFNNGNSNPFPDPIDFLNYTGLPVGGSFDFQVQRLSCTPPPPSQNCLQVLQAALYTDQNNFGNAITFDTLGTKHIAGPILGSQLTLGVKALSAGSFESYRVTLSVTPPSRVSQPATIALLLAGLTGLQILRRRKGR